MPSPYIIDIRWRIASEEKAARMEPTQPPRGGWSARRLGGKWGVIQYGPKKAEGFLCRFVPTPQTEFDRVNARYRD